MSKYRFEDEYEDELDRMRAKKSRKRSRPSQKTPVYYDFEEDDFQIEYLEEEWDVPTKRAVSPPQTSRNRRNTYQNQKNSYRNVPKKHVSRPQGKRKKGKQERKKKKTGFFLIFFAIFIIGGFLYGKRWMKDRDGYWNIAVFGVDSRDSNLGKGALADVQMIASINKKTGEIRLVSVYRDTYLQINNDGEFHKINEAYFKGGHQQALAALKRNLDIEVDDYATFNWKAVADAINILGGIDLEITDSEFAYINSFITETVESTGVYSTHLQSAGMNHLDGVQAVAYSRLRLMDTDFNRTERQRKVVSLALEKAKLADFNTLKVVAATVIPEISTSIGLEDVFPLARSVSRYHLGQSAGFPFAKTTDRIDKRDCVIPMTLESNVILLHQFLFDLDSYQPSSSVREISAKISEKTGIYEEGKASAPDQGWTNTANTAQVGNVSDNDSSPQPSVSETAGAKNEGDSSIIETPTEEMKKEETSKEESSKEPSSSEEEIASNLPEETSPAVVEPLKPEETTLSEQQIQEGPGAAAIPSSENYTKPAEPSSEEYGPGFE